MNTDLVNKLLYLTHDRWHKSRITNEEREKHLLDRSNFKEYLELFIENQPNSIKDIEMIIEYGKDEEVFLIKQGVFEILKKSYPEIHDSVIKRQFSSRKKVKNKKKLFENDA